MSIVFAEYFQINFLKGANAVNILERIQLLCEENNITVSKLEVELGLGKGTLYKWNKSSPNSDKLSQVADYFNVSVDWLLGKTEFRKLPDEEKLALDVQRCEEGNEYLFSINGKKVSTPKYYEIWNSIMNELEMEHTPHECRHTFRSRLDSAGANKVCIDLMMGHKSKEVGERVYTHKTVQELKDAIELITR